MNCILDLAFIYTNGNNHLTSSQKRTFQLGGNVRKKLVKEYTVKLYIYNGPVLTGSGKGFAWFVNSRVNRAWIGIHRMWNKSRDYLRVLFFKHWKWFPWTRVLFSSISVRIQGVRGACVKMGEDRRGHISPISLLYWILSQKLFHECEGSCKFSILQARVFLKSHYPQSMTYHHARPTTHDPPTHANWSISTKIEPIALRLRSSNEPRALRPKNLWLAPRE